eukprot:751582-Hanusia_phi.AAC.1
MVFVPGRLALEHFTIMIMVQERPSRQCLSSQASRSTIRNISSCLVADMATSENSFDSRERRRLEQQNQRMVDLLESNVIEGKSKGSRGKKIETHDLLAAEDLEAQRIRKQEQYLHALQQVEEKQEEGESQVRSLRSRISKVVSKGQVALVDDQYDEPPTMEEEARGRRTSRGHAAGGSSGGSSDKVCEDERSRVEDKEAEDAAVRERERRDVRPVHKTLDSDDAAAAYRSSSHLQRDGRKAIVEEDEDEEEEEEGEEKGAGQGIRATQFRSHPLARIEDEAEEDGSEGASLEVLSSVPVVVEAKQLSCESEQVAST